MISKNKKDLVISYLSLIILSVISIAIYIHIDSGKPDYYNLLAFLPIGFGIISCIFVNVYFYLFKHIGITMLVVSYYFRMVMVPLIMSMGEYESIVKNMYVYRNMNKSILLMIFEAFMVFMVMNITINKYYKETPNFEIDYKSKISLSEPFIKNIIIFSTLFLIYSIMRYPQLKYYFKTFVSISMEQAIMEAKNFAYMQSTTPSLIYWSFTYIGEIMKFLLPALIIKNIKEKSTIKDENTAYVISFIIVIFSSMITTINNANSLIFAIVTGTLLLYMYPKKRKITLLVFASGIGLFVLIGLFFNSGVRNSAEVNVFKEMSAILQAYFSGPANVSTALSIEGRVSFKTAMADILRAIPFLGYNFQHIDNTPTIFNKVLYMGAERRDQIIPLIGQGYYYFGFIFAPIFSIVSTFISIKSGCKVNSCKRYWEQYIYIYISVFFSIVPILYNLNIGISTLGNMIVPMYIITKVFKKTYEIV